MRSLIRTKVIAVALVGIMMATWVASSQASRESISTNTADTSSFRSAFLGPSVWKSDLSSTEIRQQLQDHFAQVIERLESTNASSLLRALIRAEASSDHRWTKSERREALISLATNRVRQIARLRYYMHRGLFPQNEGQSTSAVPIFVDRNQTHCAVGFLMHSDGKDSAVASIVQSNNLVRVNDVRRGSLINWIRSSGLTQEEAALIQPAYPIDGIITFADLSAPNSALEVNGIAVSQPKLRSHFFDVTLPVTFQGNTQALENIFQLGRSGIENSSFETPLGAGLSLNDEELYLGSSFTGFGAGLANTFSNQAAIVELEYLLRSDQKIFSQITLASRGGSIVFGEQSASLLLSQIYDGETDALLGETQLSITGSATDYEVLAGSDSVELSTDFVRIRTQSLIVGDAMFDDFQTEFETSAVPEPASGALLFFVGAIAATKRRRQTR